MFAFNWFLKDYFESYVHPASGSGSSSKLATTAKCET